MNLMNGPLAGLPAFSANHKTEDQVDNSDALLDVHNEPTSAGNNCFGANHKAEDQGDNSNALLDVHNEPMSAGNNCLSWRLWQILDSILPTGGFAHSYGLEAAVHAQLVSSPKALEAFAINTVENTGSLLLPFVYKANRFPDIENWIRLDQILHATLTNAVARKASITQGSALLRVASKVFVEISDLKNMRTCAQKPGIVHVHQASVFGTICGLLGFDSLTTQRAYLFVTLRDLLSAATRLNLIGPLESASIQDRISKVAEEILKRHANRLVEDAYQTVPLLDTVQGCQEYLFSCLFCSCSELKFSYNMTHHETFEAQN